MTSKEIMKILREHGDYATYKLETKMGIYYVDATGFEDTEDELLVEMIDDGIPFSFPLENVVALTKATEEEVDEYLKRVEEFEKQSEERNAEKQDESNVTEPKNIQNEPSAESNEDEKPFNIPLDDIEATGEVTEEELNEYLKMYEHKEEKYNCYVTANAPYPCCNHTEDIGEENLGYVQGIINGGTPFEAELWETEADGKNLSIVMADLPDLYMEAYEEYLKYGMKEETAEERLASQPGNNTTHTDASVLTIGMIMEEDDLPTEITAAVTAYMETAGLVRFPGRCSNGAVRFFIDMNGNRVIQNIINLDGMLSEAETDLVFKPFIEKKEKGYETDGNVIRVKFGKE